MSKLPGQAPGWDAKRISEVAAQHYGGYAGMFEAHGWPERGSVMMRKVQARVGETYGSIQAFDVAHQSGLQIPAADIWDIPSVWITSFWDWTPETWGTVGFTAPGRCDTILRETPDPFIVVIYVTKNARRTHTDVSGKIAGFYVVSHIRGHRNDFTGPEQHSKSPEKWVYSLKAIRAFSFLPEYRPYIDAFDSTMNKRARHVAANAERLSPNQIETLRRIPYVEVPVYCGPSEVPLEITFPGAEKSGVKAGPANRGGYSVPGEPLDTPKELYMLKLSGDPSIYLGEPAKGRHIVKIGLSVSPCTRLETFRKAMPKGAFAWDLLRSTRLDEHEPYTSFEPAVAGEYAMKDYFKARKATWLGGEFYAATDQQIAEAWQTGRQAALKASSGGK